MKEVSQIVSQKLVEVTWLFRRPIEEIARVCDRILLKIGSLRTYRKFLSNSSHIALFEAVGEQDEILVKFLHMGGESTGSRSIVLVWFRPILAKCDALLCHKAVEFHVTGVLGVRG